MSPRDEMCINTNYKIRKISIFFPISVLINRRILYIGITDVDFEEIIKCSKNFTKCVRILYLYSGHPFVTYEHYYGKLNSIDDIIDMGLLNTLHDTHSKKIIDFIIKK